MITNKLQVFGKNGKNEQTNQILKTIEQLTILINEKIRFAQMVKKTFTSTCKTTCLGI